MSRINSAIAIVSLSLLAGCASVSGTASKDQIASIRKVAVVAVGPESLIQQYVGITVFGNERATHDVSAWKLNAKYAQTIAAAAALKGFEVSTPEFDPKSLASMYGNVSLLSAEGPCDPDWEKARSALQGAASQAQVDALLVLAKKGAPDHFGNTNQSLCGLGLYVRGLGGITTASVIHLEAVLALIDGKTGKAIAVRELKEELSFKEQLAGTRSQYMHRTIPVTINRKPFETWSKEEHDEALQLAIGLVDLKMVEPIVAKMLSSD